MKKLWYTKQVDYSFLEAIDNIDFALKMEWFGILMKIDMQEKLKTKLNKDIDEYMILGACNPALAAQALDAEQEIGLLLPCNIIVYSKDNEVFVSTILPSVAMNMIYNNDVKKIAEKAEKLLKKSIDSL